MNKNSVTYKELREQLLSLNAYEAFTIVNALDMERKVRANLNNIFNTIARDIDDFSRWIADYNSYSKYIPEDLIKDVFKDYGDKVRYKVLYKRVYCKFFICGELHLYRDNLTYTVSHVHDPEDWYDAIKENIDTLILLISSQDNSYFDRLVPFEPLPTECINAIKRFLGY